MSYGNWLRLGACEVNLDAKSINAVLRQVGSGLKSITQDGSLRQRIGEIYVWRVTPFVPMKEGWLRASGRATTDGRVYWDRPYASYQYYKDKTPTSKYTTPGTGPYWTENVQPGTPEYDVFLDYVKEAIMERMQDAVSR